jgi:phosphoribosyl-ATP pyrophosphohydrolase/phosphoribosyl-AMP cyclohydrolase
MKLNLTNLDQLDFSKGDGLLPVIVQHADGPAQAFEEEFELSRSVEVTE